MKWVSLFIISSNYTKISYRANRTHRSVDYRSFSKEKHFSVKFVICSKSALSFGKKISNFLIYSWDIFKVEQRPSRTSSDIDPEFTILLTFGGWAQRSINRHSAQGVRYIFINRDSIRLWSTDYYGSERMFQKKLYFFRSVLKNKTCKKIRRLEKMSCCELCVPCCSVFHLWFMQMRK